jgi:hypothetical protein
MILGHRAVAKAVLRVLRSCLGTISLPELKQTGPKLKKKKKKKVVPFFVCA